MTRSTAVRAAMLALALTALAGATRAQSLALKGPDGQAATLTAADIAALPHVTATIAIEGKSFTFRGVPLMDLLAKVGAPSGPALRGKALSDVVLVTCKDGYVVALALAETDPKMRANLVLLADQVDGKPLPDTAGPYRLVVEGDLRAARSARMVTGIAVRRLAPGG